MKIIFFGAATVFEEDGGNISITHTSQYLLTLHSIFWLCADAHEDTVPCFGARTILAPEHNPL
jgi:hypothetical protein